MKYSDEWFEHNVCSMDDPKLQEIMRNCGVLGIGAYWILIELMFKAGGKLKIAHLDDYAYMLRIDTNVLQNLTNCKAFEKDSEFFWTTGVLKRIERRKIIGEKRSEAVSKRKDRQIPTNVRKNHTNVVQNSTLEGNYTTLHYNTTKKNNSIIMPPSLEQVVEYCKEKGYLNFDAQNFLDFNAARGWMIGKHKIKDWKATVRTAIHNAKKYQKEEPQKKWL